MTKAERLLHLITLIRSYRSLTSKQLAEKCSVSERTIFRDINSLAAAGFPIYYDRGYKFLDGAFLPTLNMTEEELSALKLALEFSPIKSHPSMAQLGRSIQAKLEAAKKKPESERSIRSTGASDGESTPGNGAGAFLGICRLLTQAINQKKAVRIKRRVNGSRILETLVEPLALMQGNPKWQVLCFCQDCGRRISYDLSRIESISPTSQLFRSKPSLDEIFPLRE
jgi:predicted DNA-binding transcriptional regulator YafY